jgi:thiol:disulfide interchange protein
MEILRQAISVPIFGTVIWLAWVVAQAYGAAVVAALLACLLLLAIAGWFLGRWPAQRWATIVAALIVLWAIGISVFAPGKLAETPTAQSGAQAQQQWEPWSPDALSKYQALGRPVLVDFTASWCLSCQVNERVALSQPAVQNALKTANVALLKADWTRHDESITQALAALDRSGVPAYALYVPGQSDPHMLPEVLTPGIVIDALSKLPSATNSASQASASK